MVFDGSDGETDYRVNPGDVSRCGTFYRDNTSTSIVWGTWWQPEKEPVPSLACYDSMEGIDIVSGSLIEIGKHIRKRTRQAGTFAIRDYFLYWKGQDMTASGGKPLFFKFSKHAQTHEVFFDDNIRFSDAHIVHPVDMTRGDRKTWAAPLLQTHLARAEPLEAIGDKNYFVKVLDRLECAYTRKLVVREKFFRAVQTIVRKSKDELMKREMSAMRRVSQNMRDPWQEFKNTYCEASLRRDSDTAELESFDV
jgi:hypothetical protein